MQISIPIVWALVTKSELEIVITIGPQKQQKLTF
jgi:hypothetical protein